MAALTELTHLGSTSTVYRLRPGIVLKSPSLVWNVFPDKAKDIALKFSVEKQILDRLGDHPRIVKYEGKNEGILLAEASHGSLQQYIDDNNDITTPSLRKKWCRQAAESITYLQSLGVIHSDLRPENFLLHGSSAESLDIWLCDFGGSSCKEIDADGMQLPDAGFFDPREERIATPATDIFSLGSALYFIMTGYWPFKSPGLQRTPEEMNEYESRVDSLFAQGIFPDVERLAYGNVMMGCWTKQYDAAAKIVDDLDIELNSESAPI